MLRSLNLRITPEWCVISALLTYLFLSITLAAVLFIILPEWQASLADTAIPPRTSTLKNFFIAMLALWSVVFCLSLAIISAVESRHRINIRRLQPVVLLVVAVIGSSLALRSPLYSTDFYDYLAYGRTLTAHFVNPYHSAPDTLADPLIASLPRYWTFQTSVYGPVLLGFAGLPSLVFSSASLLVYSLKAVWFIAYIALAYLFGKFLAHLHHPLPISTTWAFLANPVSLWLMLLDGHNEVLILLAVVAMLYFLETRHHLAAGVAWGIAAAVKIPPLVLGPILLHTLWRRARWGSFAIAAAVTIGIVYLPFSGGLTLASFQHMLPTFRNVNAFGPLPLSLHNVGFQLLPTLYLNRELALDRIIGLSQGIFLIGTLGIVLAMHRLRPTIQTILLGSTAQISLLLITTNFLQPWYVLWLFPVLLPLIKTPVTLIVTTLFFTFTIGAGLLTYNPGATMRATAVLCVLVIVPLYFFRRALHAQRQKSAF